MATVGVLPTYFKYISVAPGGSARRTLRVREKYIVVLVLATFLMVCIGAVFYLPELRASNAYRHIKNAGPDLLLPPSASDRGQRSPSQRYRRRRRRPAQGRGPKQAPGEDHSRPRAGTPDAGRQARTGPACFAV
ncbi:hypothetical protein MTO96_010846 [Rhipicephalus appendiculatus]